MRAKPMSYKKVTQYIIDFVEEYNFYDNVEVNSTLAELVDYIGKRQRPDLHPMLENPVKGRYAIIKESK